MLTTLLLLASDSTLTPWGVYGTIGGAGGLNLFALGAIYRAIAAERKERTDKIDQLYSHVNAHFARRETIEVHLAQLKAATEHQTKMLRAFIDAQASLSQQQGRLEVKLENLERNRK